MASKEPVFFRDRVAWRKWLANNHDKESEVWILVFKKHTGKQTLSYEEALQDALCYGWIDSRMRRIDAERHTWRFAPRKPNSIWSLSNRQRAERLIKEGKMTPHGMAKIKAARKSGKWEEAYRPSKPPRIPKDLKDALMEDESAWKNYQAFARSYRHTYIYWVNSARRDDTRLRRIAEVVRRSKHNLRPGMV